MTHIATIEHTPEAIAAAIRNSYTGEICDTTLRTKEIFIGYSALAGEPKQWNE